MEWFLRFTERSFAVSIKNKNNEYMLDIINRSIRVCPQVLIDNAEEIYHAQLVHAALSGGEKRIFLVSGPSASGKTTTAEKLRHELLRMRRDAVVISMDDFYKERPFLPVINGKPNPEVVEALEVDLLTEKMTAVIWDGEALLPVYDFLTGKRTDNARKTTLSPDGVLIVEGIHALNPAISRGVDPSLLHRIYVSPHSGFALPSKTVLPKRELRFLRRMVRDSWARGSSAENTFLMWREVCRCEDRLIRPLASSADITVDTTHAYEPAILREQSVSLLEQIPPHSPYFGEARALLYALQDVAGLSVEAVPQNSLLREFVGV